MEEPRVEEADRTLDAALVLALVDDHFPELDVRRVTPLGAGFDKEVWQLDDRFVGRFPRTAEAAARLDLEEGALGLASAALDGTAAVPRVVGRGRGGKGFPYDFLVCGLIPGVMAKTFGAESTEVLQRELGEALARVHSVRPAEAAAVGLELHEFAGPDDTGVCLVHGDLGAHNLLVAPDSGGLGGIIDWAHARIGHPAEDFQHLLHWAGWPFVNGVLEVYGASEEDELRERISRTARLFSLGIWCRSIKRGEDPSRFDGWIRNAFAPDEERGRGA